MYWLKKYKPLLFDALFLLLHYGGQLRSSELFFFSFFSSFFNKLSFFICIYIFFVGEGGLPSLCVAPPCVYKLHSMGSAWGIKALVLCWVVCAAYILFAGCGRKLFIGLLFEIYFNFQNVAHAAVFSVCVRGRHRSVLSFMIRRVWAFSLSMLFYF